MSEVKKVFKLAADSINGVYEVCEIEGGTYLFDVFLDSLDDIIDGEVMYCYALENDLRQLATYYHVELL